MEEMCDYEQDTFQMRSRISIRGCVRPSVGPSVRWSVGPSVTHEMKMYESAFDLLL